MRTVSILTLVVVTGAFCTAANSIGGWGGKDCGIQCVYIISRFFDRPSDYQSLVENYISSREGSSMSDLVRAVKAEGLYPYPMKNLRLGDLLKNPCPAILHVRASAASRLDHFVVFFPALPGDRKPLFYEPLTGLERLEQSSVAARWDGQAILVSSHPLNENPILRKGRYIEASLFGLFCFIPLFVLYRMRRFYIFTERNSQTSLVATVWSTMGSASFLVALSSILAAVTHVSGCNISSWPSIEVVIDSNAARSHVPTIDRERNTELDKMQRPIDADG